MNISKKIFAGATATYAFLLTRLAFAQSVGNGSQPIKLTDPLGGSESFTSVANSVANFLFADIAIPLTTIMVLVGAFQIMTAGGDSEKFTKGRKTLMYAAIGFAAAVIATGATSLIKSFLGQ